jgi:hypothetical protein
MAARSHMNPAVSPEQYRLAQAVLSGTARTGHMSVEAAREIVDKTPKKLRSEYSRFTQNPTGFTGILYGKLLKRDRKFPGKHEIIAHQSGFSSRDTAGEWAHKEAEIRNVPHNVGTMSERDLEQYGSMEAFAKHRGYKLNPFYGDLDVEAGMVPAWMYYDTKEARDAAARMYEGRGKQVVVEHSMFGFKEGGGKKWRLRGVTHKGNPGKPTIYEALVSKLGRVPTNAELKAEVARIKREAYEELATKGKLPHQRGRRNPQPAADDMYASFHGEEPDEVVEYENEEHYHSHLAALGELVELKVKLVNGGRAVIGFESVEGEDTKSNPDATYHFKIKGLPKDTDYNRLPFGRQIEHRHAIAAFKESAQHGYADSKRRSYAAALKDFLKLHRATQWFAVTRGKPGDYYHDDSFEVWYTTSDSQGQQQNPFWPFNSFTHSTIYHVGTGEKYKAAGTFKGYTLYRKLDTDEFLVPAIDKDSRFDTLKDAKAFVNSWTKHAKNPQPAFYIVEELSGGHMFQVKAGPYPSRDRARFQTAYRQTDHVLSYKQVEKLEKAGSLTGNMEWHGWAKNPGGPFQGTGKLLKEGYQAAHKPMKDFLGTAGKMGGYLDTELGRALNPNYHLMSLQQLIEAYNAEGWIAFDHPRKKTISLNGHKAIPYPEARKKMVEALIHEKEHPRRRNPSDHSTGPAYLTSNEDGTQLFITGGDQSLDLPGLGITGPQAEKELVTIGQVTNIVYHAHKVFDGKREEFDYTHKLSEDSNGPLPVLVYDRINQQLKLSGGMYKIERPLVGTSPGIED